MNSINPITDFGAHFYFILTEASCLHLVSVFETIK